MRITVKCYATLAGYTPPNAEAYDVEPETTIAQLLAALNLPLEEVKLIFVNGAAAPPETVLTQGDRVGFFPAVGGG